MAELVEVNYNPFKADVTLEPIEGNPFVNEARANKLVIDGITSNLRPNERVAVEKTLPPKEIQNKEYIEYLNLKTGINHTQVMAQANLNLEYGDGADVGTALKEAKKVAQLNSTLTASPHPFSIEGMKKSFRKEVQKRKAFIGKWSHGLIKSTLEGRSIMSGAEQYQKRALEGDVEGSVADYFQSGAWDATMNNNFIAAASSSDRDKLKELQKDYNDVTSATKEALSFEDRTLGGKIIKGVAQSAYPMIETIVAGAATGPIPFLGKAVTATYWQQQGAGSFMKSALADKDIDSLSDEQLRSMNGVSQIMGVPYGVVELAIGQIPGVKAMGGQADQLIANVLMKKALKNPTMMAKVSREGIAFGIRWLTESLIEEGAQGAIEESTLQMLEEISAGNMAKLPELLDSVNWAEVAESGKSSGIEALPATFGMTVLGLPSSVAESRAFTKGEINAAKKQMEQAEIQEAIKNNPDVENDPIGQEKLQNAFDTNGDTVNEYNKYIKEDRPNAVIDKALQEEQEPATDTQEVYQPLEGTDASITEISERGRKMFSSAEKVKAGIEKTMRVSTRLKRISPKTAKAMRDMESATGKIQNKFIEKANPFVTSYREATKGKTAEQITEIDVALHNLDLKKLKELGFKNIDEIRQVFSEVAKRGNIEETIQDYFPRKLKDYDGLVRYLAKKPKGPFSKAIDDVQKKSDKTLTQAQKEQAVRNALRSGEGGKSFQKSRTIDKVTPEIAKFYESPIKTLVNFINQGAELIARNEVLGITSEMNDTDSVGVTDESVAAIIAKDVEEGSLTKKQEEELKSLIKSRLEMKGTPEEIRAYQNLVYLKYVTNIKTAVKQFGDVGMIAMENGLSSTFGDGQEAQKYKDQFVSSSKSFIQEIGINELDSEMQQSFRNNIKEYLFLPLSKADAFNKELLAKSTMVNWSKMAKENPSALTQKLNDKFGITEFSDKVVNDLAKGKWTEDVASALYMQMSDFHPVSHLEHAKIYMDSPRGRMLFTLKSFPLTRWDRLYREATSKMIDGIAMGVAGKDSGNMNMTKEGGRQFAEGLKGLVRFMIGTIGVEVAIEKMYQETMKLIGLRKEPKKDEKFDRSFIGMYMRETLGIFPWLSGYDLESFADNPNVDKLVNDLVDIPMPLGVDTITSAIEFMQDKKDIKDIDKWKRDIPYVGSEWYKNTK